MFLECREDHVGGRQGQVVNFASKTPKSAGMPKTGKSNKIALGLVTGIDLKLAKTYCKTREKKAKRTNGSIFTRPQGGVSRRAPGS